MNTRTKMDDLKARYLSAKTEVEKDEVFNLIRVEIDADADGVANAALAQITETNERAKVMLMREQLQDILPVISLSFIARRYFGKTKEWLYQRINGNIVNGKAAQLTKEEKQQLNNALHDIAGKLSKISVS